MRNIFIAALFFATQVFAADTVINTDKLKVGKKSSASNKVIEFDTNSGSANPKVRVDTATSKIQFANDGTSFKDIGFVDTTAAASIGSTNAAGTSLEASRVDHTHQGVHSISKSGSAQLYSDVTLSAGTNISLTQSGQDIAIAATSSGYSAYTSYTPTITGFGTVSSLDARWREDADTIQMEVNFTTGTVAATGATISLPAGKTIASYNAATVVGQGGTQTSDLPIVVIASTGLSNTALYFGYSGPGVNNLTVQNGNALAASASRFTMFATFRKNP